MDRDEAIRRAEMFVDWVAGKNEYQAVTGTNPTDWRDIAPWDDDMSATTAMTFMNDFYMFRIKPKPLECWVWFDAGFENRASGTRDTTVVCLARGKPDAIRANGRWVRMHEVTNETDD